jgi:hypothetical protein
MKGSTIQMRRRGVWVAVGVTVALETWGCGTRNIELVDVDGGTGAVTDGAGAGGTPGTGGWLPPSGDGAAGWGGTGLADGSAGADKSCGASQISATSVPANILLVIDKSGSMKDPLGGTSRWNAMKMALGAALDKVKGNISFGLEFFPNGPNAQQVCDVPAGEAAIVLPIGAGTTTVPQIVQAFDTNQPAGGTPTAAALARAYDYFTAGAGKALTGDRYVLLATDGGPNCNPSLTCTTATCTLNLDAPQRTCGPRMADGTAANCCDAKLPNGSSNCLDDAATATQIAKLAAAQVKTFVVGIAGTEAYAKSLDQFAVAGGVTNPDAPPSYFAVTESGGVAGLTAVFSAITTRLITTCRLQLQSEPPDPMQLNVSVDGTLVPLGANGWHLDTSTTPPTIVLDGALCSKVQVSGASSVQIVYGCPTVIIK